MTKKFKIPEVTNEQVSNDKRTLPYNGNAVSEKSFSFSFSCFDRTHELFNLGDATKDCVMKGKWFLDFLDCLKGISNMTVSEAKNSMHQLHLVKWESANTKPPRGSEQCEYWQFRLSKSKGRVIGILIDGVFYIVWLDPHHNLINSEGYGKEKKYYTPKSEYETMSEEIIGLKKENKNLKESLELAEEMLDEACKK